MFWFDCVSFTGRVGWVSFTGGVGLVSFMGWFCVSSKGGDCWEIGSIGDMKRVKGGVGVVRVVVVYRLN